MMQLLENKEFKAAIINKIEDKGKMVIISEYNDFFFFFETEFRS